MRIMLPLMVLATVVLVACQTIYTPETLNLPKAEDVIVSAPTAMDNKELCAYTVKIEAAVASWETYINNYVKLAGKEPIAFTELVKEYKVLDNLLEARNLTCVVEEKS